MARKLIVPIVKRVEVKDELNGDWWFTVRQLTQGDFEVLERAQAPRELYYGEDGFLAKTSEEYRSYEFARKVAYRALGEVGEFEEDGKPAFVSKDEGDGPRLCLGMSESDFTHYWNRMDPADCAKIIEAVYEVNPTLRRP